MYLLITGTCISHPINISVQIVDIVWCSSGIIFGSCCDGDFWLGQVKCVPLSLVTENLEAENNYHRVLQL